jgi:hypothetical protein
VGAALIPIALLIAVGILRSPPAPEFGDASRLDIEPDQLSAYEEAA